MAQIQGHNLGLKQFTKDVPPGWRPRAYQVQEYKDLLDVWSCLTKLDEEQIGPAIMSRLEGAAWKMALNLRVVRPDPISGQPTTYKGVRALCLVRTDAVYANDGLTILVPVQQSGAHLLIQKCEHLHQIDDPRQGVAGFGEALHFPAA